MTEKKKLILLGLDGVGRELLELQAAAELRQVLESSFFTDLQSVYPYYTGPAFASFQTGVGPEDHGILGFISDTEQGRLYKGRALRRKTFYEILHENGLRVFLLNLPLSYPPRADVDMITSFLTPSDEMSDFIHPSDLAARFPSIREYRLYPYGETSSYKMLLAERKVFRSKCAIIEEVLGRGEHDVVFFLIRITDWIQHACLVGLRQGRKSRIERLAGEILGQLGKFLESLLQKFSSSHNFIMFSDHGFRVYPGAVFVRDVLADANIISAQATNRLMNELRYHAHRLAPPGSRRREALKFLRQMLPGQEPSSTAAGPNEESGPVRCTDGIFRGIRVAAEWDDTTENLKDVFRDVKGVSLVPREKLFRRDGEFFDKIPEFAVLPGKLNVHSRFAGRKYIKRPESDHSMTGIVSLGGECFSGCPRNATLRDLMPTVLYLSGCPIPESCTGRVLTEAFSASTRERLGKPSYERCEHSPRFLKDTASADDHVVMERLRKMGYLE
ncbi:MAG: alkaline phosphatase family protein [Candidatus Brocadiia bacterium]